MTTRQGLVGVVYLGLAAGLIGGCKSNNVGNIGVACTVTLGMSLCPADTEPTAVTECGDAGSCVTGQGCAFQCAPIPCTSGTTRCAGATAVQICENGVWTQHQDCATINSTCTQPANGVAGCENCPVANETRCPDTQCYDLTSSNANCGACGHACSTNVENGSSTCTNSECKLVCDTGFDLCSGTCVASMQTNLSNCGTCGTVCAVAGGSQACVAGVCQPTCDATHGNCDGNPDNGCETDTATTPASCGGCIGKGGTDCTALPNVNATAVTCAGGQCSIPPTGGCQTGWSNCDANTTNGCESNNETDTKNCGACVSQGGFDCTSLLDVNPAGVACIGGACAVQSCTTDYTFCPTAANPDLCTDTSSDPNNCGTCKTACTNANGTTSCNNGVCKPVCDSTHLDCDGNPNNGCETSDTASPNCGACNNACAAPTACGFFDNAYTCETCEDLGTLTCGTTCVTPQTDPNNCGSCGTVCPNGTCANGYCTHCQMTAQQFAGGPDDIPWNTYGLAVVCPNMRSGATVQGSTHGTVSSIPAQAPTWSAWFMVELSVTAAGTSLSDQTVGYANCPGGCASYAYSVVDPTATVPVVDGGSNGVTVTAAVENAFCGVQNGSNCTLVLSADSVVVVDAM